MYSAPSRTHPNLSVGANFLFKWYRKVKMIEVIKPFTDSLKISPGNLSNCIAIKPRYTHHSNLCECRIAHFTLKFKRHRHPYEKSGPNGLFFIPPSIYFNVIFIKLAVSSVPIFIILLFVSFTVITVQCIVVFGADFIDRSLNSIFIIFSF